MMPHNSPFLGDCLGIMPSAIADYVTADVRAEPMLGDDALQVQLAHALEERRPGLLDVIHGAAPGRMIAAAAPAVGICLTTAVKCGKVGYGIWVDTIHECQCLLDKELALFRNVKVLMLGGDVAIKARKLHRRATRTGTRDPNRGNLQDS
jgi:hypothetical protein